MRPGTIQLGQRLHARVAGEGEFYVIQLVPDLAPQRVKLGWSANLDRRLNYHRCTAPTARLVQRWRCLRTWERSVIKAATSAGCEAISDEVFDVDRIENLLERVEQFFVAGTMEVKTVDEECLVVQQEIARRQRLLNPSETSLGSLRRLKPLTQRELADRAGVSEATIRVIETGRQSGYLRPRTMRQIADALGVQPAEIDEFRPSLGLDSGDETGKLAA